MNYPDDFNVPAFPAGKVVAFTRGVSIWIMIVFFLIIAACGFLLLGRRLTTNFPFLVSIDPITEEWIVVAYPGEKQKSIPQYQYIQEKLVNDFVKDWFTVSNTATTNNEIWQECSVEECNEPEMFNPDNKTCAISCKSSADVFDSFVKNVLPDYTARISQANETWRIPDGATIITPVIVSENGSKWQVYTVVNSSVNGNFNVFVFVDIERNIDSHNSTFGYYVNKFNAYRVAR